MRNSFFFYIYIHRIILNGSIIQREKEKAKTKMDNLFIRISSHFYVFHSRMSVASPSSNTIGRILFPNCPFTNSRFLAKHKQRSIEIPVAKHTDIESFNFQPSNARDTFPNDSPPVRARPMIAPRNKTESVARGPGFSITDLSSFASLNIGEKHGRTQSNGGRQSLPLRATLSHGYSPLLRLDWGLLIRFSVDIEVYCSDLELTPVVTPFRSLYRIRISRCFRPVIEPTVDASFQISFRVSVSKETSHCAWSRNLNRKEEETAGL